MTSDQWRTTERVGLACVALLIIAHLLFREKEVDEEDRDLVLIGSNIIGMGVICAGVAAATPREEWAGVMRLWVITLECGAAVVVMRLVERQWRERHSLRASADHGVGRIDGVREYDRAYSRAAEVAD